MNHLCSYGKSNPRSYMLMQLNYFKHNLSLWWCFEVIDDFQTVESRECSYQTAHFDFFLEVFASCLNSPQTNSANSRIRERPTRTVEPLYLVSALFILHGIAYEGSAPRFGAYYFFGEALLTMMFCEHPNETTDRQIAVQPSQSLSSDLISY